MQLRMICNKRPVLTKRQKQVNMPKLLQVLETLNFTYFWHIMDLLEKKIQALLSNIEQAFLEWWIEVEVSINASIGSYNVILYQNWCHSMDSKETVYWKTLQEAHDSTIKYAQRVIKEEKLRLDSKERTLDEKLMNLQVGSERTDWVDIHAESYTVVGKNRSSCMVYYNWLDWTHWMDAKEFL